MLITFIVKSSRHAPRPRRRFAPLARALNADCFVVGQTGLGPPAKARWPEKVRAGRLEPGFGLEAGGHSGQYAGVELPVDIAGIDAGRLGGVVPPRPGEEEAQLRPVHETSVGGDRDGAGE